MRVASVGIVQGTDGTVVILREADGSRVLIIGIGPLEASAIAMELEGIKPPRPVTHDLMRTLIERFGAQVRRVVINDLREETFYATIDLETDNGVIEVDSRPSDAMALALRAKAPIFCSEAVLDLAAISDEGDGVVH